MEAAGLARTRKSEVRIQDLISVHFGPGVTAHGAADSRLVVHCTGARATVTLRLDGVDSRK